MPGFDDVVCGLLFCSNRVLLVHRSKTRAWAPNRWDAPGGHVEPGESDRDAIVRELNEELGIIVARDDADVIARLSGSHFDVRVFKVSSWLGVPVNRATEEHDDLGWFDVGQVADLDLADADLAKVIMGALPQPERF